MIKEKWVSSAKRGQKDYRIYKIYRSGKKSLVYQTNSLAKARDEKDEFFRRGKGGTTVILVNKEGYPL
ncbi:hypothetical protein KAW18_01595 [candidate division WOR-3 bacterium]|nr:hypothetical protein [candidate division WOR-3 bacterium]